MNNNITGWRGANS